MDLWPGDSEYISVFRYGEILVHFLLLVYFSITMISMTSLSDDLLQIFGEQSLMIRLTNYYIAHLSLELRIFAYLFLFSMLFLPFIRLLFFFRFCIFLIPINSFVYIMAPLLVRISFIFSRLVLWQRHLTKV